MNRPLRIAIAEDDANMRDYLEQTLALLGHQVVASARTGLELVEQCSASRPDLVLTDIKMPDLDGIDAVRQIYSERPVPIILLSGYHDEELIARARDNHVLAYLVKPIKRNALGPSIYLSMCRFEQLQAIRQETYGLRQALEDRELIERAKRMVMKMTNLDEVEAFRRLQKLSNDKRCKLVDIARSILSVGEGLQP